MSSAVAGERLAQAAAQRQQDVVAVERVLSSPAAARVASTLGVRLEPLRAGVPALGDREIRDLAARAARLRGDPVAGFHNSDPSVDDLLKIFLIVAIVVILIEAAK